SLAALGAASAAPAAAQQVDEAARERIRAAFRGLERDSLLADSLRADTTAADTTAADTLAADTLAADTTADGGVVADSLARVVPELASDSIVQALRALEGYTVVEYAGESLAYGADSVRIVLTGPAQLQQAGQRLESDSLITYSGETALVCGYGRPIISGQGATGTDPIESEYVCYNVERRVGVAVGARTTFTEGATWHLEGDVYTAGEERIYGSHADFTTCDLEVPHYHFSAKELKVKRGDMLVARNVTLNFADVPVFWLPFLVQSLERGRQSGLLMPEFSVNDIASAQSDWDRRISNLGFYWAINDYMGLRVAGEWFSNHWTSLESQLDFRWLDRFLSGNLAMRQFFPVDGGRQLTLRGGSSWEATERTRANLSLQYASSSEFVARNTADPREATQIIQSNAGLSHRFQGGANLSLTGNLRQDVTDGSMTWDAPRLNVSLPAITLFQDVTAEPGWYNNLTLNGSGTFAYSRRDIVEEQLPLLDRSTRDAEGLTGSTSWSARLGRVSLNASSDFRRDVLGDRREFIDEATDSVRVALQERTTESASWNLGLNYQQNLIGSTTFTPNISLSGELVRGDSLGVLFLRPDSVPAVLGGPAFFTSPVRVDFGATIATDVYGFFPGVGPFEAIRHKISPSLSYSYAPATDATLAQRAIFGTAARIQESNVLRLQFSQTFEGKFREEGPGEEGPGDQRAVPEFVGDSAVADTMGAPLGGQEGEPRRLEQARKMMLLSLTTSALSYDFVEARTGEGFRTTTLTNNVSSDLVPGLNMRVIHDLFEQRQVLPALPPGGTATPRTERRFAPHLTNLTTSFSLDNESWIFRLLGLGPDTPATQPADTIATDSIGDLSAVTGDPIGVMPGETRAPAAASSPGRVGTWSARFNYSLMRPRPVIALDGTTAQAEDRQHLSVDLRFQPTENWTASWSTAYNITEGEFDSHYLNLARDLHEWQANFAFSKAPNGNFIFNFLVRLTDLPDLKLDYDQRSFPAREGAR
ncbi:MAG: putative LPS assembly protein LptD, partial [Longimicrobiales bacterium]